ncbi:MAG: hypothetical protein CMJ83_13635 [Planctomycetes bacterium]|nr:hypothetical protein [Planctomycetota bacterium]
MSNGTQQGELFGHPTGLFTLFFAEMWERFSYYGMRALLVFYMLKGFLGYGDSDAYAVYGAYTALVYMTPFFGGLLADRFLGQRRAVILGGILMGLGHLVMTVESEWPFFFALALLIAGNGFFKPNISTMVGTLYPQGSPKRDGGFIIFYMGINLGAALAPLLCGYIGETYGWHWGFGLATLGMFVGLAVFWLPTILAQALILGGAIATAGGMMWLQADSHWALLTLYTMVALALVAAGVISFRALGKGGLPDWAGQPPSKEKLHAPFFAGLSVQNTIFLGTAAAVAIFTVIVRGTLTVSIIPEETLDGLGDGLANTFVSAIATPAGLILVVAGVTALVYLLRETFKMDTVPRERMYVALILIFFSMLFWSFFEQAGSSVNNCTDRNVDRTLAGDDDVVATGDVGKVREINFTQGQLGFRFAKLGKVVAALEADRQAAYDKREEHKTWTGEKGEDRHVEIEINPQKYLPVVDGEQVWVDMLSKHYKKLKEEDKEAADTKRILKITEKSMKSGLGGDAFTLDKLDGMRDEYRRREDGLGDAKTNVTLQSHHVGMKTVPYSKEIPASTFQSVNPIFIIIFGFVFTAIWALLASRGLEPSTPFKFALGLLQLGLGFGAFYMGAANANDLGMISMGWLMLGYLLQTTGELCLSPVGLSMVTKLSPARLVSTVMGMWFLATAFSNLLAAVIASLTGVAEGDESAVIPAPKDTVDVYGEVFGKICIAAMICAGICFILVPVLKKWMHEGVEVKDGDAG